MTIILHEYKKTKQKEKDRIQKTESDWIELYRDQLMPPSSTPPILGIIQFYVFFTYTHTSPGTASIATDHRRAIFIPFGITKVPDNATRGLGDRINECARGG